MDIIEVFEAHRRHERQGFSQFDLRCERGRFTTRFISPQGFSFIAAYQLDRANIQEAIDLELERLASSGGSLEWKVYSLDEPPELVQGLLNNGFAQGEAESFQVYDLQQANLKGLNHSFDIRRMLSENDIYKAVKVQEAVWGQSYKSHAESMIERLRHEPESLSVYGVFDGHTLISSAWITYTKGSPFAGLWGGSTLEAYRGRGAYRSLLEVRALEAIQRGRRYLTIDASDMSRPIVEKMGFQAVCLTWPFEVRR